MTADQQFWLNFVVQALAAAGTVAAVLVALFGEWIKGQWFPPQLRIKLDDPKGVLGPATFAEPDGSSTHRPDVRWYRLNVWNEHRWSPVTEVQVFLVRVEEPDASGRMRVVWDDELPLRWVNQEVSDLRRTVGQPTQCDLCTVVGTAWLELMLVWKNSGLQSRWRSKHIARISLRARGVEGDSNLLTVDIAWDGLWSDDPEKMSRHLVIKEVS